MNDDWDDEPTTAPIAGSSRFAKDSGFRPAFNNNEEGEDVGGWGDADVSTMKNTRGRHAGQDTDDWGNSRGNNDEWGGNDEWGNRSRGRGGGRGRGSGFAGNRDRFNDDNDGWGGSSQSLRGSRGGRGRAVRGRDTWGENGSGMGRGGGRGHGDFNAGHHAEEKPREIYVPVERVGDDDLFTTTITSGVNFMKLTDIEVNVSGDKVPDPITSFENSGLRPLLLENVKKSGYTKPTPIQKYAIPIISNGRDLMGCAQTGSGKTAAFLLPIIDKLMEEQSSPITEGYTAQPNVVIISPTRELAIQIYDQARKFAYNTIVKIVLCYGGTSVVHQRNQVTRGCHILVATPGRINDFVTHKHVSFVSCQCFILDEADRMLDMGFLPMIEEMLGHETMPSTGTRQTLMFSATFPEEIQFLAGKFLYNYVFVAVGIVGSASTDVEQHFHMVSKFDKRRKLIDMLQESNGKEKTVVFVETKRNADFLATMLSESDIQATSIHGDRLQREREQALWDFKKGIRNILVATGVAARGLDIEGIQHVINYDLPKSIDEYVHRIGRTGRVGNRGKATSFYDPDTDSGLAGPLGKILEQADITVPDFLGRGGFGGGKSDAFGGKDVRDGDFGNVDVHAVNDPFTEEW